MAPNALLLRQVLAQIEQTPETWDQAEWRIERSCGTAMCFAGWTVELNGGRWIKGSRDFLHAEPGESGSRRRWGTTSVHVGDRAQRLLGLDTAQTDSLYSAYNNLDDIRRQVTALIALTHHVTIVAIPEEQCQIGEVTPDGRTPLTIAEHRPGEPTFYYGSELGIHIEELVERAQAVAAQAKAPYIDPIDPDVMAALTLVVTA